MVHHLSYAEALIIGALQGITELFPVSSLGHSVLIPALIGGQWARDLNVSTPESPYLAFIVGLHVATAAALLVFFWRDWIAVIAGFISSVRHRRVQTPEERLAWLLVLATIPVGIAGLALEHLFRTTLGKPVPAAAFLLANGVILLVGERLRRRREMPLAVTMPPEGFSSASATQPSPESVVGRLSADDQRIARQAMQQGVTIGSAQILALLPGISRSGVTIVAGLLRGLSHAEAARFAFLLATPVILAAGVLKIPDLFGPLGEGIHSQILAASAVSFLTSLFAVGFLTRYFETRTLTPFAVYCMLAGAGSMIWLTTR
ncbi:undecaprenyl-diphosphate phosphatase [Mycobacterium sp. MMS18-G62]